MTTVESGLRTAAEGTVAARVVDLTKVYGSGDAEVRALDGVTLDVVAGEFTAVMGPSGSGKSTLMHCCAALDNPTSGQVFLGDTEIGGLDDKRLTRLRRERIGFVFQSFNLVPTLTADENILLPLSIAGRKPDREWYDAVIDTVDLRNRLAHRPNQLSGGQQQRVAVARALVSRPEIVFADEPTGNLDSRSGAEVLSLLRRSATEFGQTIVMVTHDPVAAGYTDRVVFLADGRVAGELREPDPRGGAGADGGPRGRRGPRCVRRRRQSLRRSLTMLRAAWKSLLARKLRLLMSTFAIVLGVAFVSGTLIFTDTLNKSFVAIFDNSVGDVVVRPAGAEDNEGTATTLTIPASLVDKLAKVPGAARADGNVVTYGLFVVGKNNRVIGGQGAPGLGVNTNDAPAAGGVEPLQVVEGRDPRGKDEVAIDTATAKRGDLYVGEKVRLISAGKKAVLEPRLVGIADYPEGGSLNGATVSMFDTRTAQQLFLDGRDVYNDAWVTAADGTSQQELRDAVAKVLPQGVEAVTGEKAAADSASQLLQAINFITIFLLVFALIALVVGMFLIVNTFSMLVAQRSRELALFRALGASRRQITRSVLFEAFVVGLVGSAVGLGLGVLLAMGIRALFGTFGLDLSGTGLVFGWRTPAAAFAVGLIVHDDRGVPPRPQVEPDRPDRRAARRRGDAGVVPAQAAARRDAAGAHRPRRRCRRPVRRRAQAGLLGRCRGPAGDARHGRREPGDLPAAPRGRRLGLPQGLRQHRRPGRSELPAQPPAYGGHRVRADDRAHPGHHDVDRGGLGEGERGPHHRAHLHRRHRGQQRDRAGLLPGDRPHRRQGARGEVGDPHPVRDHQAEGGPHLPHGGRREDAPRRDAAEPHRRLAEGLPGQHDPGQ